MGLAGPRRPIQVVEVTVGDRLVRGVVERVNDTVLVTTRDSQVSARLNGRDPEDVARELLMGANGAGASTGESECSV